MKYGLIGESLSHSLSPEIHSILGNKNYSLLELTHSDLDSFFRERNFCGINVTIPFKSEVVQFLDVVEPTAKKLNSVNTVINRNGILYGYNTDVIGLESTLKKADISFADVNVIILGTGGTSASTLKAAERMGAGLSVRVSRSKTGDGIVSYREAEIIADSKKNIIINTTPCGMFPDCDCKAMKAGKKTVALFDAVYNPLRTDFLLSAEKNVKTFNGMNILAVQAVYSDSLFFGSEPKINNIPAIVSELTRKRMNIVLSGMPSCGKTTVGRIIADKTGRKFIDTDEYIYKKTGIEPKDIIRREGIDQFRKYESDIISELDGNFLGGVIATGGGCVLNRDNVRKLKHNGRIVFLETPFGDLLEDKDRPLSSDRISLKKLFDERKEVYCSSADFIFKNDKKRTPFEIADGIIELFNGLF